MSTHLYFVHSVIPKVFWNTCIPRKRLSGILFKKNSKNLAFVFKYLNLQSLSKFNKITIPFGLTRGSEICHNQLDATSGSGTREWFKKGLTTALETTTSQKITWLVKCRKMIVRHALYWEKFMSLGSLQTSYVKWCKSEVLNSERAITNPSFWMFTVL